ncbi:reverse transcriptase domain-containing protein [Tanacetum coccineum]
MKFPNVPNTSVKLMLFPFSLEGAARIWLEKEPPRSILTWDDLVSKFINKFFPPSKTTNLQNEITRFQQKFDETFYEAWDRFNDLLRGCPHHGFSELHQLDTFYNSLNSNDQDSLNSAAGVSPDVAELKDMVRALLLDKQTSPVPAPAPVKAVEQSCVTCGGAHSYRNCPATDSNNYRDNIQEYVSQAAAANFNQGNSGYRPPPMANQIRPPGFPPMQHNSQANNQNRWNQNQNQNRGNGYNQGQIQRPQVQQHAPMYQPPVNQHPAYQAPAHQASGVSKTNFESYVNANDGRSGSLPSNTIANPKGELKAITTRSGVSYDGPQIPPPVVEVETEVTKDTVLPNGSTKDVQPPIVQVDEPVVMPRAKTTLPYPSRVNKEKIREKDDLLALKFMENFRNLHFELSFADALLHMPNMNDDAECDLEKDILLLEAILNSEPLSPLPNHANYFPEVRKELKICEAKTDETSIDEPPEVELKDLPPHLEYAFLEGDNKLPVIIAKDLSVGEKAALIKVLQSHKRAIAWKLSDIKGINPEFCTHKILMEEDYTPAVQHQRRVNPKIHDVIKKEVEKLLNAGLIYPISDSPWVSPVHCVPKKSGFTVVENEQNELIPTRLVTGWRVCIDLPEKLNEPPEKTTFTTIMDQIPRGLGKRILLFSRWFLSSFSTCLTHLEKMLKRCEDTNLALNWEKSHFMVKEGIVLGHKISKSGIEVDRAKIDVIAKLPHPTTVKESNRAPILSAPDWNEPFELMCDASDFALGAVLGHTSRRNTSRPIHILQVKIMMSAESRYTTTEERNVSRGVRNSKIPILPFHEQMHWKVQLNELNELRDEAYENSLIYKEKTKRIHDSKIKNRVFNVGDRVLLFNSRLKIFSGKLKTRWSGPFSITQVFPYGTVELSQKSGPNFKVNGHRIKHYFGGDVPQLVVPDLQTFPNVQ